MTRLLVCPPTYFGVEYVINPWMAGNVGAASQPSAMRQWDSLVSILEDHADVFAMEPRPGLPDMCFAANGGFVLDETFVPASFSVVQREPEAGWYRDWADAAGFDLATVEGTLAFEGEGDALWWPNDERPLLWAGYGVRTSLESHRALAGQLRVEVASLRLVDQRFYHLDTCFVPLPGGRVIYYPPAFDERSRQQIESLVPADRRIEVGDEDALGFACNAVRLDQTLITSHASGALRRASGYLGLRRGHHAADGIHQSGRSGQMPDARSRPGPARRLPAKAPGRIADPVADGRAGRPPARRGRHDPRIRRREPGGRQLPVGTVSGRRAQRPDESGAFRRERTQPGTASTTPSNGFAPSGRGLPKTRSPPRWLRWNGTVSHRRTSAARRSTPQRYASTGAGYSSSVNAWTPR